MEAESAKPLRVVRCTAVYLLNRLVVEALAVTLAVAWRAVPRVHLPARVATTQGVSAVHLTKAW